MLLLVLPLSAQEVFEERVAVERIILDAYVTDRTGRPVDSLTAADFRVSIGGKPAEVESAEWIPVEKRITGRGEGNVTSRQGRLIILFFQTDMGRSQARVRGHMEAIPRALDLLAQLDPSDLVAVVQFDSHLKVRCDFTNDSETLRQAITGSLAMDRPEAIRSKDDFSLLDNLDIEAARGAASPEEALRLIGLALHRIPGAKALVMFGHGLGVNTKDGVVMTAEYHAMRLLLELSRTTVFALDLTAADHHSLEIGLQNIAADTGGFYERTFHSSPRVAVNRLTNVLNARYELVLKRPDLRAGRHDVRIRLGRSGAQVQAKNSVLLGE